MNYFDVDHTVTLSLGAILGYLLNLFVQNRLALSRSKQERLARQFSEASGKFRSSVLNELGGLYPATDSWSSNITEVLSRKNVALETAVREFRCFLPDTNRANFDIAWEKYITHCERVIPVQCDAANVFYGSGPEGAMTAKEDFKRHVENLLLYAAHS